MNKNDIKLIIALLIILLFVFITVNLFKNPGSSAKVYYDNSLILTIDLGINRNYTVKGYNGDVVIGVENRKIRVISENSPKHLCSKQGFIDSVNQVIICLPNKIIIEIDGSNELDGVVR